MLNLLASCFILLQNDLKFYIIFICLVLLSVVFICNLQLLWFRLKNWIDQQAEREKEAKDRKQKKLERLCEPPKHEFNDEEYNKERSVLPELVEDAVLQGLQASASCSTKRKQPENKEAVKMKKPKLW